MPNRILVVDDSVTMQRVVAMSLAATGHEIVFANNGDDALRKAVAAPPDLIVLDTVIPGTDGYKTATAVRAESTLARTPILFLVPTSEPYDAARGQLSGSTDFVVKPFDSKVFIDKVTTLMGGGAPVAAVGAGASATAAKPGPVSAPTAPSSPPLGVRRDPFAAPASRAPTPSAPSTASRPARDPFAPRAPVVPLPASAQFAAPPAPKAPAPAPTRDPFAVSATSKPASPPPPPPKGWSDPFAQWTPPPRRPAYAAPAPAAKAAPTIARATTASGVPTIASLSETELWGESTPRKLRARTGSQVTISHMAEINLAPATQATPAVAAASGAAAPASGRRSEPAVVEAAWDDLWPKGEVASATRTAPPAPRASAKPAPAVAPPLFIDDFIELSVGTPETETATAVAPAASVSPPATQTIVGAMTLDDATLDALAARIAARLTAPAIERVAWEVIPALAETLIREELSRLIRGKQP